MTTLPNIPRPRPPGDRPIVPFDPTEEYDPETLEGLRVAFLTSMFPAWVVARAAAPDGGWEWSAVRRRPLTPQQEEQGLVPRLEARTALELTAGLLQQERRGGNRPL